MLEGQQRRDLVHYRIEKAYKSFDEAKGVAKLKYWNLTGNRLYYTVFHMASALLLDKGFTAKTHAGVIHLVERNLLLQVCWIALMESCSLVYMNFGSLVIMMIPLMLQKKRSCRILRK